MLLKDEDGITNDVVVIVVDGAARNAILCDGMGDTGHRESIMVFAATAADPNVLHKESDVELALAAIAPNGFMDKLCVIVEVAVRKTLFVFFRFFHLALCLDYNESSPCYDH